MVKKAAIYAASGCLSLLLVGGIAAYGLKKSKSDDTTEEQIAVIADELIPEGNVGSEEETTEKTTEEKEDDEEDTTESLEELVADNNTWNEIRNYINAHSGSNANTSGVPALIVSGNTTKPGNNVPGSVTPNNTTSNTIPEKTPEKKPDKEPEKAPEKTPVNDTPAAPDNTLSYEGFDLKWADEFNGSSVNTADWNYETHEPGWVNSELQAYVVSDDNIYVQDGKLVIRPIKTGDNTYTSGRINTQGKHDYTYGRFEVRAKVPSGSGYLPAFWLMPTDENLYGQWPRCGEIDAMEVMGSNTAKVYGTIHYGNPHDESQGTYITSGSDFSESFHTFTVDWEPGKITWYVDGIKYHEENDWYSTTVGQGTVSYPAPFDQPFYMILNLAVGGSWVGNPDENTDFDNQTFEIDYVRVYQKTEGYDDTNVQKPEKDAVVLREPNADGNYINNGNFVMADALDGSKDWQFMTALGGVGSAKIVSDEKLGGKAVKIETSQPGTVDYSIQFVQANVPFEQGYTYTVSFDAYAAADRNMIVDVSAPDHSYERYLSDTVVGLTTEKKSYSYSFNMEAASDANGRLEFNLGNQGSTADVYITNVKITKGESFDLDTSKKVLTDGNYIYNGSFQEGANRMAYWSVDGNATYGVTALADGRRFYATAKSSDLSNVKLVQTDLPIAAGANYAFSFKGEGEGDITVTIAGQEYSFTLTAENKTYSCKVSTAAQLANNDIVIAFNNNTKVYLDDIRLVEDAAIKNGSFNAGLAGYEVYAYTPGNISYTVDSISEDNAFDITIKNTGALDWYIQLKQGGITLEKGKWYTLSFDAKSSYGRKIMYAIQRNGNTHNDDWTPYVQKTVAVDGDYQRISATFQMKEDTDADSVLSISMGAVDNVSIATQHRICIDNISLVETTEPVIETPEIPGNLIKNAYFAGDSMDNWTETIANWGDAYVTDATRIIEDGKLTYVINNPGTEDWHIQLKQSGITLVEGKTYELSYKLTSSSTRLIKSGVMSTTYNWYGGDDKVVNANEETDYRFRFTMNTTDLEADFYVSLGMTQPGTPAGTVTMSDFKLVEVEAEPSEETPEEPETPGETPEQPETPETPEVPETPEQPEAPETPEEPETPAVPVNMLVNTDFAAGMAGWIETIANWGEGYVTEASSQILNGKIVYTITNVGTEDWHVQLKQSGIKLEAGKTYDVSFDITSETTRQIKCGVMSTNYNWYGGADNMLQAGVDTHYQFTFTMGVDDPAADFYISMGMMAGETPAGQITISNFKFVERQ